MKTVKTILAFFLVFSVLHTQAQTEAPKGYTAGSITLADGTVKTGFVKDNARKKASISFMETAAGKSKTYDGWAVTAVTAGDLRYTCINGDFFTLLCAGELQFLQKASEAPGKIEYNGSDPILRPTTEGRAGDYFVYNTAAKELVMITKQNYDQATATVFKSYEPAVAKAKETRQDPARLKQAVELYNQRPAK
jgi:hypothetical protein